MVRPLLRIDVVTIFPEYLTPLELSLIGKARTQGLLDVRTWDLRAFTQDRHRTVDDTPYGGGAGMVMRPQPWGRALDAVDEAGAQSGAGEPVVVFPSPSGERFTQRLAAEMAGQPWLVFACGRYEGIDERVAAYARDRHPGRVRAVSLGDYVLNGGEVAVLTMVEAIARLLPGVLGNAASLNEESHADGLLEYPVYTRPPSWRGYDVPPVLLSGDHAAVARWRREQQLERTAARRPDLLNPSALAGLGGLPAPRLQRDGDDAWAVGELDLRLATPADAPELLVMQRACWLQEGRSNASWDIPPLAEGLDDVHAALQEWTTWLLRHHGRLIGGVRTKAHGRTWHIGRLFVAPDLRGRGLGRWLLAFGESQAPPEVTRFALMTGANSRGNLRMYRKAGYRPVADQREPGVTFLARPRR